MTLENQPLETRPYDTAEHLNTEEDVVLYIEAILEENDPALFAHALGIVARARGMAQTAHETGRSRESLYRSLSDKGDPQLSTLMGVLRALGLRLGVRPAKA